MSRVPYTTIETLFLDVGNTLVSMDFDWVCHELELRGVQCSPRALERAEASARPGISQWLERRRAKEDPHGFEFYLGLILSKLDTAPRLDDSWMGEVVPDLATTLRASGMRRLWTRVMPGVRDVLPALRQLELGLVAVSNSDGTVESLLEREGLRVWFDAVVDSGVVGVEKPDPRIFHHALAQVDAAAESTLHVGDLYSTDVVGARAAGVHAVLLDPFGDWDGVDCERVRDLASLHQAMQNARAGEDPGKGSGEEEKRTADNP